jgi:hypothetical protein
MIIDHCYLYFEMNVKYHIICNDIYCKLLLLCLLFRSFKNNHQILISR